MSRIHIIDRVLLKGHWKTIILSIIYTVQQQVNIYHYWHAFSSHVWISVASPRRGVGGSGPHFCSDPYLLRFAQIRWKVFYIGGGGGPMHVYYNFLLLISEENCSDPHFFWAGDATVGFNHHERMQSEQATWHVSITPNSHSYSWEIYKHLPTLKVWTVSSSRILMRISELESRTPEPVSSG